MAKHAYQPMHPAQKAVTQGDMWLTLAKHLPPGSSLPDAASQTKGSLAKPEAAIAPLVWQKPVRTGDNAGYVLSQCGRFSISKDSVMGAPMYTAWARRQPPHESINLGVRTTLQEAEHLCELENQRE